MFARPGAGNQDIKWSVTEVITLWGMCKMRRKDASCARQRRCRATDAHVLVTRLRVVRSRLLEVMTTKGIERSTVGVICASCRAS